MVTLDEATQPTTRTLRAIIEDHGYENALKVVTRLVIEADIALGGDGDPSRCVPTAANTMIGNGHRGIGFIVVSIREGMKSKVFGKGINAALLNEWTAAQEAAIIGMRINEHAQTKFVDNGGRDVNERAQYESEADKRKIQRLSNYTKMLEAQLGAARSTTTDNNTK